MSEDLTDVPARVDRGVTVSVSVQFGAKLVHLALNVVSSLAIINYLSPARYGDFVLVLIVTTLLGLLCDFGLVRVAVREVSREPDLEAGALGTVMALRLALAVVSAGLVQVVLLAMGSTGAVRVAAAVASLYFVCDALLAAAIVFHVRLRQQYEALALTVAELVETALVLVVIARGGTFLQLVAAPVVGGVVGVVIAVGIARGRFRARPRLNLGLVRPLMRAAVPVAANGFVGIVVLKLDGLMLGALRPSDEIGLYGAAFQPVEYLLVATVTAVTVVLPLLSRYHRDDPARFEAMYRRGTEVLLAVMVPLALLVAVLAQPAVRVVYSDAYADSAAPMRVLAVALVMMSLCAWQAIVLLAAGRQRVTLAYNCGALVLGAVIHLALIPTFGYMGAAVGTLGTTAATALVAGVVAGRLLGTSLDRGRLARLGLAHVLALAVFGAATAAGLTVPVAGSIAVLSDIGWLRVTRALRIDEFRALLAPAGATPLSSADRLVPVAVA